MHEIEAAKVKARPGHIPYASRTASPHIKRSTDSLASRITRHCWPWGIREYPGIMRSLAAVLGVNRWRSQFLLYKPQRASLNPTELTRLRDYLKSHAQQSLTLAAECDQAIRVWRDPVRRGFLSVGKDGKSGRFIPKTKLSQQSALQSSPEAPTLANPDLPSTDTLKP